MQRNLRPLLEGIPQDNGVGLIKGGLQIILNAVQRRTQTCQIIFDTFESIPRRVMHAELLHKAHPKNSYLRNAIASLYLELIKSLPSLIKILLREEQSRWKKYSKPIFGDSTIDVEEILKPVTSAEMHLQESRKMLVSQGVADIFELSQLSMLEHQATQTQLQAMQEEILIAQEELAKKQLSQIANIMESGIGQLTQIIRRELEQGMKNEFYMFLQETERIKTILKANALPLVHTSPPANFIRQFTDTLCTYDEREAPFHDRTSILRKHHDFSFRALARADQLFTHHRFRQWVSRLDSDIVLVNGQCGGETMGGTSALSIFCAGLVNTFSGLNHDRGGSTQQPQSPRIILEYFSGQHNSETCGLTEPQDMMRSLLDQLLQQWPRVVPLDLASLPRSVSSRDLSTTELCILFETAVMQLAPRYPIWCIIDNISHYDTSLRGWKNELIEVIESFWRCVNRPMGASALVKFLLASANRCISVLEQLPKTHRIDLEDTHLHVQSHGSGVLRALLKDQ